jgi:hypothetical protein
MSRFQSAQQAQRLLDDAAFISACQSVQQAIVAQWASPSLTIEQREALWHKLQGLNGVKAALASMVGSGRMEAIEQEAKAPVVGVTQGK